MHLIYQTLGRITGWLQNILLEISDYFWEKTVVDHILAMRKKPDYYHWGMNWIDNDFNTEVDKIIVTHAMDSIPLEKDEPQRFLESMFQCFVREYDEIIEKYGGLVPYKNLQVSDMHEATYPEEYKYKEYSVLKSYYPSEFNTKSVAQDITNIINHIVRQSGSTTPIWVELTQYKEANE